MTPVQPFTPVFSRETFLETPELADVLRRLDDGLGSREPFLILTGEPGTGKTTLAHEAIARWGTRVTAAFLAYPARTAVELLEEVVRRLGGEPAEGAGRSRLLAEFERSLAECAGRGQVALLVVDDAHALPPELLEELRLLANVAQAAGRAFEVFVLGLPAIESSLEDPALASLRQRVAVRARLTPLSPGETRRYLQHRIQASGGDGAGTFPRKACRDVAVRTGGVPRRINVLAVEALRVARAWGDAVVGAEHVQTAAATLGGFEPTGDLSDASDAGAEDAATPAKGRAAPTPPAPPAPVPAPRPTPVATAPRAAVPSTPVPSAAAPPAAVPRAAVPPAAVAPPPAAVVPPVPARHDPREWVARFVGDSGPVQLSSRALAEPAWIESAPETAGEEAPISEEAAAASGRRPPRANVGARPRHPGAMRVVATVVLSGVVVFGAVALVMRARGLSSGREAAPAAAAKPASAPPTSLRAAKPAASQGVTQAPTPPQPPRAERTAVAAPVARGPHTLEVAGPIGYERAFEERERLQLLTGFEGWVVPAAGEGSGKYRVVLGIYRSHQRASAVAEMLLTSRTLDRVHVVPLPPRSQRQ